MIRFVVDSSATISTMDDQHKKLPTALDADRAAVWEQHKQR